MNRSRAACPRVHRRAGQSRGRVDRKTPSSAEVRRASWECYLTDVHVNHLVPADFYFSDLITPRRVSHDVHAPLWSWNLRRIFHDQPTHPAVDDGGDRLHHSVA